MSKENKNLVLGALLVAGFFMLRRQPLGNTAQVRGSQWGNGAMPGSQGSGTAQVAAGLIGSLAQWAGQKVGAVINSNPNPTREDVYPSYDVTEYPEYAGNQVIQNMNLDENPTSPTYWGE
jgi:hypothetical protein